MWEEWYLIDALRDEVPVPLDLYFCIRAGRSLILDLSSLRHFSVPTLMEDFWSKWLWLARVCRVSVFSEPVSQSFLLLLPAHLKAWGTSVCS